MDEENLGSTVLWHLVWIFNLLHASQHPSFRIENNEQHEKQKVDSDPCDLALNLWLSAGDSADQIYHRYKVLIMGCIVDSQCLCVFKYIYNTGEYTILYRALFYDFITPFDLLEQWIQFYVHIDISFYIYFVCLTNLTIIH